MRVLSLQVSNSEQITSMPRLLLFALAIGWPRRTRTRGAPLTKYQYSVPAAEHGADLTSYFGPAAANQGPDLELAIMSEFGSYEYAPTPADHDRNLG